MLLFEELDDDIVETLSKKKIGGEEFIALTDDVLSELFPIIGKHVKVRKLIDEFSGKPEKVQALLRSICSGEEIACRLTRYQKFTDISSLHSLGTVN